MQFTAPWGAIKRQHNERQTTMWKQYSILMRYRTKSGCNAKAITLIAESPEQALHLASAKVARMRGVIKIDSSEWTNERQDHA